MAESAPQLPSRPPAALVLALTTEADQERATALARALLARQLVACVSLQPVQSLYHWQGRLEQGQEVQLLLKTSVGQLEALERAVLTLHSYDTPQWIHWPAGCSGPYGRWLAAELSPDGPPPVP